MSEEFRREFICKKNAQTKRMIASTMEAHCAILMEHLKILFPSNEHTFQAMGTLHHFQDKMREAINQSEFPPSPYSLGEIILEVHNSEKLLF